MKLRRVLLLLLFAGAFCGRASCASSVCRLTRVDALVPSAPASPGTPRAPVAIPGLGAFDLVGIDIRTTQQTLSPANPGPGTLWALGLDGVSTRLFVINPATAAASPVGGILGGLDGSGSGSNGWFFGHNPGTDRFRAINSKRNYLLDPNTLFSFEQQNDLTGNPNLNGSAFETASFGQDSDIFFVEQSPGDPLFTSANIATGGYTKVGDTGLDFAIGAGLDIAGPTTLLAAAVAGTARLYTINRTTGAATEVGAINGNPTIRALAIVPATLPRRLPVTISVKGPKRIITSSPSVRIRGTARSQAGIKRVEYRVGKAKPKKAKGTTRWSARVRLKRGLNKIAFRAIGGNDLASKPRRVQVRRT